MVRHCRSRLADTIPRPRRAARCCLEDGLLRFRGLLEHVDTGPWDRPETSVTVSIGVAALGPDEALERWIQRADDALYRAKAGGRHQVQGSVLS